MRRISIGMLSVLCWVGFFALIYAAFIEPQWITITRRELRGPQVPHLRIAIVSDMHVGPYKGTAFVTRAVRKMNATLPDMVLLPGDFVFTASASLRDLEPLRDLRAPLGVFAVLGNHDVGRYQSLFGAQYLGPDRGDAIAEKLSSLGITVLRNEAKVLTTPEGELAVAGIDDLWAGHHDLGAALSEIAPSDYVILLSHNPSVVDDPQSLRAQLVVSGHTHGGQIRLPGLGPVATLPTSLGQSFDQGLFPMDSDTTLAITRGIGESTARFRFLAWPEILLLELVSVE